MKANGWFWQTAFSCGVAMATATTALAAGFEELSQEGEAVLTSCNPDIVPSDTLCRVTSLPGEEDYDLVAARAAPLIYNEVTIGTLEENVWRNRAQPNLYIFGARVIMYANPYDASGAAFSVNDVFRQTTPESQVSVAYSLNGATEPLRSAGRTVQGLNEFEEEQPERDNTWVDFRINVNAPESSGPGSPSSPWLLTKTEAPTGFDINVLGLRVLNSNFESSLDALEFFTAGYQPNGVPPPEDDDDDDDDGDGDDGDDE